jgi:hypothetical protein
MKRLVILGLIFSMVFAMFAMAAPASAALSGAPGGAVCGDPPGWSQENPGQGGTDAPKPGQDP